ncbi:MAG: OmpA family protein [Bacteroidota bacterium]
MDNRNIIVAAVLGLLLLEVLTLYYKKAPIEAVLLQETQMALDSAGVSVEQIKFDGRDALLRGTVETAEAKRRIEQIVADVWDVRVVDNQLTVKPPEPPAKADSASAPARPIVKGFQMKAGADGELVLMGEVHDASTRNSIVAAVLDAFPAQTIENHLVVAPGEAQVWVAPLMQAISAISVVKKPEIVIPVSGASFLLKGEVAAAVQKKAVLEDLVSALPSSLALEEQLQIVEEQRDPKLVALEKRIQDLQTTTRIQFKINTAFLADLSKEVLNQVAGILKEAPGAQIEVQGHTDNLGKAELNMKLSQMRADAVRDYLITQGIEASRLTAVGYGPTRPVATNSTRQGRIANRRVVFSLKGGS